MPGPTASVHIKQALPVALARAIDLTPFEANDLTGPVVVLATAVITGPAVVLATAFAFITGPVAVLATAFALAAFGPVVLATASGWESEPEADDSESEPDGSEGISCLSVDFEYDAASDKSESPESPESPDWTFFTDWPFFDAGFSNSSIAHILLPPTF